MLKKLLFIGHFSEFDSRKNLANSAAGNIVQKEILLSCEKVLGHNSVDFLSQTPMPIWPKGPLIVKSKKHKNGKFPGYINLPFLKSICFSLSLFDALVIKRKYSVAIQYNSYLLENVIILLSRVKSIIVIQDVRIGPLFSYTNRISDYLSSCFLKYYSLVIPVNSFMGKSLGIKNKNIIVFPGGVTSFSNAIDVNEINLENIATFAGALEAYNGVEILINKWLEEKISTPLHVFGRGSLEKFVEDASNKYEFIIYHGNSTQKKVQRYQSISKYNFCLRYSLGIKEEYFYPSKFFNISTCPGLAIYNDFYGLPDYYKNLNGFIDNKLLNLKYILSMNSTDIKKESFVRGEYTHSNFSWENLVKRIFE